MLLAFVAPIWAFAALAILIHQLRTMRNRNGIDGPSPTSGRDPRIMRGARTRNE